MIDSGEREITSHTSCPHPIPNTIHYSISVVSVCIEMQLQLQAWA